MVNSRLKCRIFVLSLVLSSWLMGSYGADVAIAVPRFCTWALVGLSDQLPKHDRAEVSKAIAALKASREADSNELDAGGSLIVVAQAALDREHLTAAVEGFEAAAGSRVDLVKTNLRIALPDVILELERLERLEENPSRRAELTAAAARLRVLATTKGIDVPSLSSQSPGPIVTLSKVRKWFVSSYVGALGVERIRWDKAKDWQTAAQALSLLNDYTDLNIIGEALPAIYRLHKYVEYLESSGLAAVDGIKPVLTSTFNTLIDRVESQLKSSDWSIRNQAQKISDHIHSLHSDPKLLTAALQPVVKALPALDRKIAFRVTRNLLRLAREGDRGAAQVFSTQLNLIGPYFFSSGGMKEAIRESAESQDMDRVRRIRDDFEAFWDGIIAARYSSVTSPETKQSLSDLSLAVAEAHETITNRLLKADPAMSKGPQVRADRFQEAQRQFQQAIANRNWDEAAWQFQTAAFVAESFLQSPEMAGPMLDSLLKMSESGLGQDYVLSSSALSTCARLRATVFLRMAHLRARLKDSAAANPLFQPVAQTAGKLLALNSKEQAATLVDKLLTHEWQHRLAYEMMTSYGDHRLVAETERLTHILERLRDSSKVVAGDALMELKLLILFHKNRDQQGDPASREFMEVTAASGVPI